MGKPDLAARILALLEDPRVDVRCAAALVLGAVGKGDPAVTRALAAKLADDNPVVRRFALDGLEACGARGLASQIVPLLGSPDEDMRERAARLLASQGARIEPALARQLGEGPPVGRRLAAQILVERGTAGAIDALLDHCADPELGEHIVALLRSGFIDGDNPKGRELLAARAAAELKKLGGKRMAERAAVRAAALLRLVGYVADPGSLGTLVTHAAAPSPAPVRVAAIAAMRRILAAGHGGKRGEAAIEALIEHALDEDPHVARAAVDTLRGAHIPESSVKHFARLSKSPHPEARRLATERLASLLGRSAVPQLLERLAGDDPALREAAARSLAETPHAAGPLCLALGSAKNDEVARRLAAALRPQAERVPPAAVASLADAVRQRASEEAPVVGVLLDALSHLAPAEWKAILLERAGRLRRSGRHADALLALRPLASSRVPLDNHERFTVGLLALKAGARPGPRGGQGYDPALVQLVELSRAGFPVAKELSRQKDLTVDDLFALGFRYIESSDDNEKGLGAELLELVAEKDPRGKLGVAARNKLKLAGELE